MARRRRKTVKRSTAAKLVEIVGVIVIFWLIATIGVPYLVSSFTDRMAAPTPAVTQ